MEIKTKFDIGQRVWCIEKNDSEKCVLVYSGEIEEISYSKRNGLRYYISGCYSEYKEDELIEYEDGGKLLKKIDTLDKCLSLEQENAKRRRK